jgi:DNA-binding MarR family transcriptional regulator
MNRDAAVDAVVRALRRVNFQGTLFGQRVAIQLGLSESDIHALETLIDTGAATAGRLAEVMNLTTGAVTRVIDRLEQAGYVRRVPDPADRRRVVVEPVPEKVAAIESLLDRIAHASEEEIARYTEAQIELISEFLSRMEALTREETDRLRDAPPGGADGTLHAEHAAPLGGLTGARLAFRSGASELVLAAAGDLSELYRASFEGAVPQVRVRDGTVSVQYRGMPFDWRKRSADITLNASIPWDIEIHGGASSVTGRLVGLDLRSFEFTGGSSRLDLSLGRARGVVPVRMTGGASEARIERPRGVGVRLTTRGGTGRVEFDAQRMSGAAGVVTFESANIGPDHFAVELTGGVGRIEVRESAGG